MLNKKIITIAVSAVLILALAGVGIYGVVTSGNGNDVTVTQTEGSNDASDTTSQGGADTTSAEITTYEPESQLAELILGKWTDSANMSGYHFYMDGTVEMTYVNLTVPIINVPINGTSKGVYTLDGDKLTTKFSIYSATIDNTYIVSVENNTLSMYNIEEGETATYARASADTSTTATAQGETTAASSEGGNVDGTELVGSWVNSDGTVGYSFNKDGTAKITIDGESFSGVYMTVEDEITLQYTAGERKITEKYTYTVSKNSLSLEDGKDTILLVRKGTTFSPSSENELLGIWRDGANMSGYEFLEGGVAKVTFVNFTIPVINMPINGTFTGSYAVSGDEITVNYSIYGNSITDKFTFSVNDNVLSLVDDEGETSTYLKQ
ncbi:MAG: hypothetical protein IJ491_07660 [Clostridia bacterium]|nr:hypothetical protein [Clostridia bacterium]